MSDDFWSDFIVGDQNFDGNVDYLLCYGECKISGIFQIGGEYAETGAEEHVVHQHCAAKYPDQLIKQNLKFIIGQPVEHTHPHKECTC